MLKFKNIVLEVCLGCVLGIAGVDMCARGIIAWYNIPVSQGAMCPCEAVVHDTVHTLLRSQFFGAAGGAVATVLVGEYCVYRLKRRRDIRSKFVTAPE